MKNSRNSLSVFYQIRQKTGLSQEDLARLLDVSFTSVNRWENGKQVPKLDFKQWKTIIILLAGMGIDAKDLPDNAFGEIRRLKEKKMAELNKK